MKKMKLRQFSLQAVESYSYESDVMGEFYSICVGLPLSYEYKTEKKYSALIVLDGNWTFSIANAFARCMSDEVCELIVIGVDIPHEEGEKSFGKRRVHQFSPNNDWPLSDPFGKSIEAFFEGLLGDSCLAKENIGGADQFYKFLTTELLPDLYKSYRINVQDVGLAGNSAAGFFTAYTLFYNESPFNKYIISSPAMAYGDGEIFRIEELWSKKNKDLDARVYMGAGLRELNDGYLEGKGNIVSGMAKLTGVLLTRGYPNLEILSDVYEDVGHIDSFSSTIARGLRRLFSK